MEQDTEKLNTNSEKIERDENGRLKKGVILNPTGRPKGSRDFYTDFKEAIQRIKDKNTGEAITELDIIKIGIEKMLKGDARFEGLYRDLLDRVYGKPLQKTENNIQGSLTVEISENIAKKHDITSDTENNSG